MAGVECAIKLNFDLSLTDQIIIESQMKITNWAYNKLLEYALAYRIEYAKTNDPKIRDILYTKYGLRNLLPKMKEENPFLKTVHSSPLKNAALRLTSSIKDYQDSRKGKRKGKKTNFPKFRSHKVKPFSLLYDEIDKGIKIDGRSLRISLGTTAEGKRLYVTGVLEKALSEFDGIEKVCNLRIKKEHDRFFAVFTVVRQFRSEAKAANPVRVIALDPNHKNLAYGVDNQGCAIEITNFPGMKYFDREIDAIKSKRDKCKRKSVAVVEDGKVLYYKASRRWTRLDEALKSLQQKRRDQTKQMLQTLSNFLSKNYEVIAIGDYTPRGGGISRGMRRSMNNRSLIGRFKTQVAWTAFRSGKRYLEWPEHGSTKTCSQCSYKLEFGLVPDIRKWQCPSCLTHHHRDENAAMNGLKKVMLENLPCSGQIPQIKTRHMVRFTGQGLELIQMPAMGSRETSPRKPVKRRASMSEMRDSVSQGVSA